MPLQQLEIENFKSYKGKQVIGPFYSFTSIIGPNGAGKSNLMDAISFVLGVKSAVLRSTHIKDLVYRDRAMHEGERAGVEAEHDYNNSNNPTRASVTAVYETNQGETIRFCRTATTQGTSEYKVNGKVVKWEQYNNYLEEQNILVKARNFLVFQGDVEQVASQDAKDLTKLIEQISGSWEYREEYDRLKKLQEQAAENSSLTLNKKRAMASEVKQFKEQKEEAERFEARKRELAQVIMRHVLWQLYHNQSSMDRLDRDVQREREQLEKIEQAAKSVAEERLTEAKRDFAVKQKEMAKRQKEVTKATTALESCKPELGAAEQKVRLTGKKVATLTENLRKQRIDTEKQQGEVETLERQLQEVNKAETRWEQEVAKRQPTTGSTIMDDKTRGIYDKLKAKVAEETWEKREKLSAKQRQLDVLKEPLSTLQRKKEDILQKVQRDRDSKVDLHERLSKEQKDEAMVEQELRRAEDAIQEAKNQYAAFDAQELEISEKLAKVRKNLENAKLSKHDKDSQERKRMVLEDLKKTWPGVYGRVVDLCRPHRKEFNLAMETVLGRNLEAIVVDTQKTAIDCIQYCRTQRIPPMTFLPLDSITVKQVNESLRGHAKLGARLAMDVVSVTDPMFEKIVQYACGNTLICDSVQVCKDLVYHRNVNVKCVALDGTVVHKNGNITGGTWGDSRQETSKFDEKQLSEWQTAGDNLTQQLMHIATQRKAIPSEEVQKEEVNSLQARLTAMQEAVATSLRKIRGLDQELASFQADLNKIEPELMEKAEAVRELEGEIGDLQDDVDKVEDEIFKSFVKEHLKGMSTIRDYEQRQAKSMGEVNKKKSEFATTKAKLTSQLNFLQDGTKTIQSRLDKTSKDLTLAEQDLEKYQKERDEKQKEVSQLESTLTKVNKQLEGIQGEFDTLNQRVTQAKQELNKVQRELDIHQRRLSDKESELESLNSKRLALLQRCKLEGIRIPLKRGNLDQVGLDDSQEDDMEVDDDLEINFDGLNRDERHEAGEERDALFRQTIRDLEQTIEAAAPNMKAIDKLDEVENNLKQSAADFEKARQDHHNAMTRFAEVKTSRTRLFTAAFKHIADRIDHIYKDLTRTKAFPMGGTAYLTQEDGEEPYLGGIKYHAMPPSKRFREMESLSGGEKTVAALALLLAIHSFQPAPFFVLDEVDAALDNVNVLKVANYIKRHANADFQFIVISLKNTMYNKAEALVGVYRDQQVNSSKTLTLKLDGEYE